MSTRLALVLAVILGVVAAVGVRMFIQQKQEALERKAKPVAIVVAKRNLKKNEPLKLSNTAMATVPRNHVVLGMIPWSNRLLYVNKILNRNVEKGRAVYSEFLETDRKRGGAGAPTLLDDGRRALTLRVDQVSGVAYLIRPGDRIDIFGTFDVRQRSSGTGGRRTGAVAASGGGLETKTICLMEAVRVLATDNRTRAITTRLRRISAPYHTLTLDVSPREGGRLINAMSKGRIHLMLRAEGDVRTPLERETGSQEPFRWDK